MATGAQVPVSEHVRRVPAALRPTLQAARRTIKAVAPKAVTETAYRAWPIRYGVGDVYVIGLGDHPRWVSVFFFRGAELDDPDGILVIRRAFALGGASMGGVRR